ncbi:lysozyme [Haloechinothrix sp. LS1_15]|uniref:lysozyme n=1 Tax=Haloechinothrix sp. LS1_15 TaxID=2652248 RepID=UPI0029461984|nr:lysozyme [Haloechinothrix sp. LS1_15]MDV6011212.1 lysozyme [Haloechinothrix sp. LS1_15]
MLLLGSVIPAAASTDSRKGDRDGHPHHAHGASMGSQIARVEGSPSPRTGTGERERSNTRSDVRGIDVSGWQREVDWEYWWDEGKRFAYVKATEGTGFRNSYFTQQYNGSYDVGMIRGAYHFALPDRSSGAAQAEYFVNNGGGWSDDGRTLPGVADLEYNPYGEYCYDKSKPEMVSWIEDFHDTYKDMTGRYPVFYTSTSWWKLCVGDDHDFGETVPLWIARYADQPGHLPPGWHYYTFWQYTDDPIDKNEFNGTISQLEAIASG